MIFDAATDARGELAQRFDVCVVGAGPAGITLARRLAAQGARVALMEAGGMEISAESQDLYRGAIVGLDYFDLDTTRLRYFGGTSNHWLGWCRELTAEDFETKPATSDGGFDGSWPIGKADLDPYRRETDAILDLPSAAEFPDRPFAQDAYRFQRIQIRRSPPTRFAEKFRDELAASERIALVLNANLVDIALGGDPSADRGEVAGLTFRSYAPDDPGFTLRAEAYALCLGGLENPRALLNADRQRPAGLGNAHDLVGRFFCEHPHYAIGEILYERPRAETPVGADLPPILPGGRWGDTYAASPQFMRAHAVLNFALTMLWPEEEEPLSLAKEAVRSVPCAAPFTERLAERVLGRSMHCEDGGFGAYLAQRDAPLDLAGELLIRSEQALNPMSRVRLGRERDAFGLRRIALDWQLSELDYETMRVAATAFGTHLAEQGIGRVRLADWLRAAEPQVPPFPQAETGGHHHMCTTRMSDDPRRGVVDRNCRLHEVRNLYLGGSSVFASPGWANPTYSIVQLALRLGDHLGAVLES